jgi:hypothetical protein
MLRLRDLLTPRKRGDYGEVHCIGEPSYPVFFVRQAPTIEDKPSHPEPSLFKIADTTENVVGRIERQEFAGRDDINEVRISFSYWDCKPTTYDVSKYIVEGDTILTISDAEGFEKI